MLIVYYETAQQPKTNNARVIVSQFWFDSNQFLDKQLFRSDMDSRRHCLASDRTHTDRILSASVHSYVSPATARCERRPREENPFDQQPMYKQMQKNIKS